MASFSSFCTFLGSISLLHAAYSAAQHRAYLRLTQQEFESLPVDIILQTVLSLLLAVFGIVQSHGELKEIRATAEFARKTWETVGNRPSFYTFKDGPKTKITNTRTSKSSLESNSTPDS